MAGWSRNSVPGARGTRDGEAYAQTMRNDQYIYLPPPRRKVRWSRLALMLGLWVVILGGVALMVFR